MKATQDHIGHLIWVIFLLTFPFKSVCALSTCSTIYLFMVAMSHLSKDGLGEIFKTHVKDRLTFCIHNCLVCRRVSDSGRYQTRVWEMSSRCHDKLLSNVCFQYIMRTIDVNGNTFIYFYFVENIFLYRSRLWTTSATTTNQLFTLTFCFQVFANFMDRTKYEQ